MCDLNKEFKLCSCDGDKLSDKEIGWILSRGKNPNTTRLVKGMISMSSFVTQEDTIKITIAKKLNEKNCFDFKYHPQNNDILEIRLHPENLEWLTFRYENNNWKGISSQRFTPLDNFKYGYYDLDLNTLAFPVDNSLDPNHPMMIMLEKMKKKVEEEDQLSETYEPNQTETIATKEEQIQQVNEELLAEKQITSSQILEELKKLKALKEAGIITAAEFEEKENALWDLL